MTSPQAFSVQDAKVVVEDMLTALALPDNATLLAGAREQAGTDMLKHMQHVFPLATRMQMSVLPRHGFPCDGEGIIRFTQLVRQLEKQDADLARLNAQLRAVLIPRMPSPPLDAGAPGGELAESGPLPGTAGGP